MGRSRELRVAGGAARTGLQNTVGSDKTGADFLRAQNAARCAFGDVGSVLVCGPHALSDRGSVGQLAAQLVLVEV